MKIILLSGGSGKRLWPLSNDQRSKQFIKVLENQEGNLESMVQRVWNQIGELGLQKDTYIATGKRQHSILKSQLGIEDNQIITEPSRRDTFPAIALASAYLYSKVLTDPNETIVVLPVDPYVATNFFKSVTKLDSLLTKDSSTLALIGINPTFPSEKYGYIVPENLESTKVCKFIEKPTESKAKDLIAKGAVWNAGVFGFKLSTMLNLLESQAVTTDYKSLAANYEILPKNSFDYEFVEKQQNISFIRYEGFWKDLGTWNTLSEEMAQSSVGRAELIDSRNTNVVNELNIPVAVIGLENIIVAAGSEGILVSTKEASPRVKEINSEYFESIRFIEEDWGVCHTLHQNQKSKASHYKIKDKKTINFSLGSNQKMIRLSGKGTISSSNGKYSVTGQDSFNFVIVTENVM